MAEKGNSQKDDLEIEENLRFHRWEWRARRISWLIMGLILLATAVGYTGQGFVSRKIVGSRLAGAELEYGRYVRYQAPSKIQLRIMPGPRSTVSVELGREFVEASQFNSVMPEPLSVTATPQGYQYQFARTPGIALFVTFLYQPDEWGSVRIVAGIDDASPIEAMQFRLP